ncbi:HTH_Tnp_Tc3_2 domain-containing protein [Trichonephila clavipes]|nr:HTH_Tnp_Tc3_2 domain-containing protein [Trichonephila clavipes]
MKLLTVSEIVKECFLNASNLVLVTKTKIKSPSQYSGYDPRLVTEWVRIPSQMAGEAEPSVEDREAAAEEEQERLEALREAEERRKEKHKRMEEEREKMRQGIRDKGGNTERHAGAQRPPITNSLTYVIRIVLMDRTATSRALSQELGSFARQQVSARTVRRCLQQHGLSVRRPWLQLPLMLHPDRIIVNGVISDEPGSTKSETSLFQMNPGSFFSIKMVTSVFGSIVVNAHWQCAFVIVILAHDLV